ncbi:FkbM family methyltransferase [Aurantimonas sp. A2-1-M11]|uniref:FkbM family methyltransferase n=1 Tax=Aurantimonas sp. A2-1-M11 TaxID=3113712 RepID=UPI002F93ADC1
MTWQTNPAFIGLRNIVRKTGLNRRLAGFRAGGGYEHAFDDALSAALRSGDVVWDVGANVGYYTKRFSEAVGPDGHVVAFEPFPATAERFRAQMQGIENYKLHVSALGAEAGSVIMQAGSDALGATSRIIEHGEHGVAIRLETGDGLLEKGDALAPNLVKIDTEGFELEVLRGMTKLLKSSRLRGVFVEVHFGLLADRGQPHAPAEIERVLKAAGLATRWVGPSHIAAERG